ncbi:hypothetical protein [Nitrosomonas sp.]|uniref:hypothetical protein n=1 Tax=Nitrosomonas sp. TaxID=42353 RepID=UPI0025DCCCFD|nr:hypothetical protein [Nitrosomonas sp.]MCC6917272.1 hypothetical protein [Nitrosomonas sp.]
MNTTTNTSSSTTPITSQRLPQCSPEVEQRVLAWINSGRLLAWIPIISQQNFPEVPLEVLVYADQFQHALRKPIRQPQDLLDLLEGVTGWLLPMEDEDIDVACGVWQGQVYILGIKDSRTGKVQTLLGERDDGATAMSAQSAV